MKVIHKDKLQEIVKGETRLNEPLKFHTSFRVGGPAEVLVIPQDVQDLKRIISYLNSQNIKYIAIGNGTNLLINDDGLSGVVIKIAGNINHIKIDEDIIYAGAGAILPTVTKRASQQGLSGLEFAAGLPATVGGATVMNAGIGSLNDMSEIVRKVRIISSTGELKVFSQKECKFEYRSSRFQVEDCIIIEVEFKLKHADPKEIKSKIKELISKRKSSQPLNFPNAGCIFKNPESDYAGRLIDEVGAKGMRIGGAKVSEKHANFIVNTGDATAQNIIDLINKVQNLITKEYGIELEKEVKFL
ncbi:UDP-N-acetylmuramate dehydrogenase [Selenihalanaerobacter shriftii]|uniref:UDP-N-acetylenolpyruvoylglucosamine reductase n=1 Tax=Selenihalanaerobacter shriftii TaxID=142842 RepID=A0A1T4JZI2_9FIRM|nr:UDP-N-acetylmuramate dehydrogenase [Selenihalanaerobacter shriftii]SJZ35600.1 UDP-N-acetylmuramate dehydrogenase [Selenihalanaerobacter shriftii]